MHWDGWSHMGWMWIWWVLIIVIVVLLIRWLVTTQSSRPSLPDTPEQELKRRYARGEINREEFQRRLEDLRR